MRSLVLAILVVLGFTSSARAQEYLQAQGTLLQSQGSCYCIIPCPVETTLQCVSRCSCPDAPAPPPAPDVVSPDRATYRVREGKLYDPCGEHVVLKGVNQLGQYVDEGGASMAEIAKTGANAVRIFWYVTRSGVVGLERLIQAALASHMVPIIEAHDSTCAWNLGGIEAAWLRPESVALIKKYERQLIVNIANEANAPDLGTFTVTYSRIIRAMRAAGIKTPLMIDAPSRCGRDWQGLLNQGRELLDADPDRNLIFSAHLYDPMSAEAYGSAFRQFNDLGLAFVVGEFANREPPGCGREIDYRALISEAQKAGIGWLAWSWGDNNASSDWNADCPLFDMTDTFRASSLRDWGLEVMITDRNSAKNTTVIPYSVSHGGQCR